MATGNHFFLDAVAGALLACLTWAAVSRVARPRGGPGAGPGPHAGGDQDGDAEPDEVPWSPGAVRSAMARDGY